MDLRIMALTERFEGDARRQAEEAFPSALARVGHGENPLSDQPRMLAFRPDIGSLSPIPTLFIESQIVGKQRVAFRRPLAHFLQVRSIRSRDRSSI